MKPRDIFGVAVRIIGFWFLTQAALWAYWAAVKSSNSSLGNAIVTVQQDVGSAVGHLLIGIILIAGARSWIWVAYGDEPRSLDEVVKDERE